MDKKTSKYFALAIIIALAVVIAFMMKDFLTMILAAIILSYLVFPIYRWLRIKVKSETGSIVIIIVGLLLLVLVPISAIAGALISQVGTLDVGSQSGFEKYEQSIFELTGKQISISEAVDSVRIWLQDEVATYAPKLLSITSNFLLSTFIVFFIMFYILLEHETIVREARKFLPFSNTNSKFLMDKSGNVIRAVFIGQVLTAIIQGGLGMFSFFLAGIEGAFFWGFIMIILSIIPVVGAFLIWVPAGLFLLLEGSFGWGLFVLLWGGLVVSQVDNLVRPKLVNKFADIHPLETFLGIFMGIAMFGIVGIIIGPLILSIFMLLIQVYWKEYST